MLILTLEKMGLSVMAAYCCKKKMDEDEKKAKQAEMHQVNVLNLI